MEKVKSFSEFTIDYNISEAMVPIGATLKDPSYTNLKLGDVPSGDNVNKALLDDIEEAAKIANIRVKITSAKSDHTSAGTEKDSTHKHGRGVDLARIGYLKTNFSNLPGSGGATSKRPIINKEFYDCGNLLVDALISDLGYKIITDDPKLKRKHASSLTRAESSVDRCIIWQTNVGGNHYNHVHVSSKATESMAKNKGRSSLPGGPAGSPGKKPITPGAPSNDDVAKQEIKNRLNQEVKPGSPNYVNPVTGATGDQARTPGFLGAFIDAFKATTNMGTSKWDRWS